MRILLLTHAFNSLTQRLSAELQEHGHDISVEFDIADSVAEEAVALFKPDLIVAPYLRSSIPESIWSQHVCLIVHPGIMGDRGPSALDWAVQLGELDWGVTVLQAEAQMDAGPVWASASFTMRSTSKASLYRHEVTQAACTATLLAVQRFESGQFAPKPLHTLMAMRGLKQPLMKQSDRALDWTHDDTSTVLRKMQAADGFPGLHDKLFGEPCHLFDAWPEATLRGKPGTVIGRRETALLRATPDGAVWIGHIKRSGGIKLPATLAFEHESAELAELALDGYWRSRTPTWQDISYAETEDVGLLYFEFYNGAMSTRQCGRLQSALMWAKQRSTKILLLMGGNDFWSNGIHLNVIEAASLGQGSAADESWRNINAMNDLTLELIETQRHITVAALGGNCGAGGCFLARAADLVWAREAVLLNPHYKNMGNLYGSEYWTYLLPRRVGPDAAAAIMRNRQPLTTRRALEIGFVDACLAGDVPTFCRAVIQRAKELAAASDLASRLAAKREQRAVDEASKPLAAYREEELAQIRRNFYGFDPSYHIARHHFVHKSPASWTPRHLARHRDLGWTTP
jgi:putative two-component system hydrogenase maturation factor HypX/HoxX